MAGTIQIRSVPEALHRTLKVRAIHAGMSLSEYLLAELRLLAQRPTIEELRSRLAQSQPYDPRPTPAAAVRAERDSR